MIRNSVPIILSNESYGPDWKRAQDVMAVNTAGGTPRSTSSCEPRHALSGGGGREGRHSRLSHPVSAGSPRQAVLLWFLQAKAQQ
jgi:hypothetical protein